MKTRHLLSCVAALATLGFVAEASADQALEGRIKRVTYAPGLQFLYSSKGCRVEIVNKSNYHIKFTQPVEVRTRTRTSDGGSESTGWITVIEEGMMAPGARARMNIEGEMSRLNNCDWSAWFKAKWSSHDNAAGTGRTKGGKRLSNTRLATRPGKRF